MNINYSFLQDELALMEIRKHKWLESEKLGREIGFASAAVDWISKYGSAWVQSRLAQKEQNNILSEKRRFRRFQIQLPVNIKINDSEFNIISEDINLVGVSCTLPKLFPVETDADVTILFPNQASLSRQSRFQFKTKVGRISGNRAFLPFTEEIRDFLRANAQISLAH